MDAMPGAAGQLGHGGKGHLLSHGQDQGLEQQGEAGELAEPIGLDLDDPPIGQFHPRGPDFQEAFVLEEVEVAQALDPGVVHRVRARDAGRRKPRPGDEINADRQGLPGRIETDAVDVPRLGDTQGRFKELVLHASAPRLAVTMNIGLPPVFDLLARAEAPTRAQHGKVAAGPQSG
jgi:hypothetical protein